MSANIPLYGQEKDGDRMAAVSHIIVKKYEFVVPVLASPTADNTVLGSLPAGFIPLAAFWKTSVALSATAVALDADALSGDPPITGALASLAADTVRGQRMAIGSVDADEFVLDGSVVDIMIAGSGWKSADTNAGTFTLWVYGIDTTSANADNIQDSEY